MSKVQICNRALSTYLGVARINSLTELTTPAEQCNLHYDDTVRALIEAHWWSFATGRDVLAELTNDRVEWTFKYARPTDALVIRWVNDPSVAQVLMSQNESPDSDRIVTQNAIYSNTRLAVCEYTMLVDDPTIYPQYFSDTLSAALAASMAMPLTEDLKKTDFSMREYEKKLDMAIAMDENESPPIGYQTVPDYLKSRGIS